jgi:glutamine synthetase
MGFIKKMKAKLEYIWLDGTLPVQKLRSKTRIEENFNGDLSNCPVWCFDGSSTFQADGGSSDLLLKPVFICHDPIRKNGYLVMCEVLMPDGTPHQTNMRATVEEEDDDDFWFGYEQEYLLYDPVLNKPLGFPKGSNPPPQGPYYCGVGAGRIWGRDIVEEHFDACLEAGLGIEGINAEVAPGQWEYQIFAKGAKRAGDELWVSRYLLERVSEKFGVVINLHPKPLGKTANWNGSGMHANFSNGKMRTCGSKVVFEQICGEFSRNIKEHLSVYGFCNEERLTGKHETASMDFFTWGVSDRGASIRIPIATVRNGWKGRLEDRRPASNADPYQVGGIIIKTVRKSGHC